MEADAPLTVRVKFPSRSVVVPLVVPDSITAAPGMGRPDSSSMVPEIVTGSTSVRYMYVPSILYRTPIGEKSARQVLSIVSFETDILTLVEKSISLLTNRYGDCCSMASIAFSSVASSSFSVILTFSCGLASRTADSRTNADRKQSSLRYLCKILRLYIFLQDYW